MSSVVGYCVKVFVKSAEVHADCWELAPINDAGEYVFATQEKAEEYAKQAYQGREWKTVPATVAGGETS